MNMINKINERFEKIEKKLICIKRKHIIYAGIAATSLTIFGTIYSGQRLHNFENNSKVGIEYSQIENRIIQLKRIESTLPNLKRDLEYAPPGHELIDKNISLQKYEIDSLEQLLYDSKQLELRAKIRKEINTNSKKLDDLRQTENYITYEEERTKNTFPYAICCTLSLALIVSTALYSIPPKPISK